MSGITPEALEHVQEQWSRIDVNEQTRGHRSGGALRDVRKSLEEMGLDLEQDATYELLEPNLTKDAFDALYTHAVIIDLLRAYHWAVTAQDDYNDTYDTHRAYGIRNMIERKLPYLEENITKTGVPGTLRPVDKKQLEMILEVYHDGSLEDDMRRTAALAAQEVFRTVRHFQKTVREQEPDDRNIQPTQEGLAYADRALEMIALAGKYYKVKDIPAEHDGFGGWDEDAGTIEFSRKAVENMRKTFLMRELAMKFSLAKDFQDQGHFVLDASGSGHGMMVIPMQDILTKLEEYGYDIHVPETYEEIGTDMETFKACYQRERQEVSKDDKYNLLKPEFDL